MFGKYLSYLNRHKISCVRFYCDKPSMLDHKLTLKGPVMRKDPEQEIFGKRILTGQETVPSTGENLAPISNYPEEYRKRRVARIYQRSKSMMQQGTNNTKEWILEFENEQRWENPCMGWCASGDSLSNICLEFPSLCSAKFYAEKEGLNWYHDKPHVKKEFRNEYGDNFSWNKRTRISTK